MLSELGKIYLKHMQEGKICKFVYLTGKLCSKCQQEQDIQDKVNDRKKKIEKIKNKKS